jgi:hypothetical protein
MFSLKRGLWLQGLSNWTGNRQSGANRQTPVAWLPSPVKTAWRLWVGCRCFRCKQHKLQRCYLHNTAGYESTCITLQSLETKLKKKQVLRRLCGEISRNTEGLKKRTIYITSLTENERPRVCRQHMSRSMTALHNCIYLPSGDCSCWYTVNSH